MIDQMARAQAETLKEWAAYWEREAISGDQRAQQISHLLEHAARLLNREEAPFVQAPFDIRDVAERPREG